MLVKGKLYVLKCKTLAWEVRNPNKNKTLQPKAVCLFLGEEQDPPNMETWLKFLVGDTLVWVSTGGAHAAFERAQQ